MPGSQEAALHKRKQRREAKTAYALALEAVEAAGVTPPDRQLQPFSVTVDILEPDLSQPVQQDFCPDEPIGGIFLRLGGSKRLQKAPVECSGCRRDLFEIADHAAGAKGSMNLRRERSLPLVGA